MEAAALAETDSEQPAEVVHDCGVAFRPCPYSDCRHSLVKDWTEHAGTGGGAVVRPLDLSDTCSLDVAQRGPETLEQVGDRLGLTKESIRLIEVRALLKLRPLMKKETGEE